MKYIILLFLFISTLISSEIINTTYYNYKNEKQIVVLFSLDEPFKGKISKLDSSTYLISEVKTLSVETKKFDNIISSVIISPKDDNNVKIKVSSKDNFNVSASMTKVGYGLKLTIASDNKPVETTEQLPNIVDNNANEFNMLNYILVMSILVILIIILIIIKKKGIKVPMKSNEYDYKVILKKPIDSKNSLMMIEVMGVKYLMMVGTSNVLLNVIDGKPNEEVLEDLSNKQQDFDDILEISKLDTYKLNASKMKEN
jgi:flagellar biogenesis protein FliO